jgi:hypothetical protein
LNVSDRGARVGLTVAWVLAIAFVHPAGNFPINDDWSYADAVRRLVETGEWRLNPWTSMPLGTQVVWGWLFSQPAGFSFAALRISTLVLAWSATLGSYSLLRLAGAVPAAALCGAATIAVCPVIFPLAFTFMTDVPTLALAVWALVYMLAYVQERRTAHLAAALALLIGTTLVRQTGLALGIGGMAALAAARRADRDRAAALALVAAPALALFLYNRLVGGGGASDVYHTRETQLLQVAANPRLWPSLAGHSAAATCLYLGLFLLPAVPLLAGARTPVATRPLMAAVACLVVSAGYVAAYGIRMPALGNILHDLGLNPVLVAGADAWPHASPVVWMLVTIAAAGGFAVVLYHAGAALERGVGAARKPAAMLFAIAGAAYLAPLVAVGHLFDRYLGLPLLLVLAFLSSVGAFRAPSRAAVRASLVLVAVFAAFDAAATRDFFAFSRARWDAVSAALRTGVEPRDLDGGFEVTGWLANRVDSRPGAPLVISLAARPGYHPVSVYPFDRWIGKTPGVLYLLQRDAESR